MLFDPAKEQFDAPPSLIELGDGQSGKRKIVTQKNQTTTVLLIEVSDSSSRQGIVDSRIDSGEDDGLIGPQSGALVDRPGAAAAKLHILARPHDEEGGRQRDPVESGRVNVSAIHDVKSPGLGWDAIQGSVIVHMGAGDLDNCRNTASQIQQRMQFHSGLAVRPGSPREQGQTEVDGGRIQSVDNLFQLQTELVLGVEKARLPK
jgi:hypothetical protein